MFAKIASVMACALAGAALAVSLAHAGPRGPQGPAGPQGQTGRNAEVAHLGLCELNLNDWTSQVGSNLGALLVTAPVLTDGVPSCPSGQFVSIVPQAQAGQG